MVIPKIFVDFQNADSQGRVRLNCVGTQEDLKRQQVELREGLKLFLYEPDGDECGQPDELFADGIVTFSEEERIWAAIVDWSAVCHKSDQLLIKKS